ncbi:MAG TPA: methyltransferase domain-containing protein [Acidimicrobiales bacterium]|nr:methyltransferase domain-containing protein [Acidimicrobiales bacterium]
MSQVPAEQMSRAELRKQLDELLYYHSIDVAQGEATKGWFDLRHALPLMPFPDVQGKRCLDIGTWDGFYAFEMERRGAAEVVALDVPDLSGIDYPPEVRAQEGFDPFHSDQQPRQAGFQLIHRLLDSKVEWRGGNVYDLDPEAHGTFDVVILGSLLVHLRDPVRALDAVRKVVKPDGQFLCVDFVHAPVQALARRGRPLFELRGEGVDFQWWLASEPGLRQLLKVGGFDIDEVSPFFLLRPGEALGAAPARRGPVRELGRKSLTWMVARDTTRGGHPHRAYLTHRRF